MGLVHSKCSIQHYSLRSSSIHPLQPLELDCEFKSTPVTSSCVIWASDLTSLCLTSLICKIKILTLRGLGRIKRDIIIPCKGQISMC